MSEQGAKLFNLALEISRAQHPLLSVMQPVPQEAEDSGE